MRPAASKISIGARARNHRAVVRRQRHFEAQRAIAPAGRGEEISTEMRGDRLVLLAIVKLLAVIEIGIVRPGSSAMSFS